MSMTTDLERFAKWKGWTEFKILDDELWAISPSNSELKRLKIRDWVPNARVPRWDLDRDLVIAELEQLDQSHGPNDWVHRYVLKLSDILGHTDAEWKMSHVMDIATAKPEQMLLALVETVGA